jgi:hypothetical protein
VYYEVPQTEKVLDLSDEILNFDIPKSTSFKYPSLLMRIFSGFKLRLNKKLLSEDYIL